MPNSAGSEVFADSALPKLAVGGVIERWNVDDPQFQCAGIALLRIVIYPNSLHVP